MSRWSHIAELGLVFGQRVGTSLSKGHTAVSYLHRRELDSFLDFLANALRRVLWILLRLDLHGRPLADEDARSHFDSSGDEVSDAPDRKTHSFTLT
jgi:hypothetical protein